MKLHLLSLRRPPFRRLLLGAGLVLGLALPMPGGGGLRAQETVPVGPRGSYAATPPAHEGEGPADMLQREIYVVEPGAAPVPTNQWWTDLVASRFCGQLWAYPLVVAADADGVAVHYPTAFSESGGNMQLGPALRVGVVVDPVKKVQGAAAKAPATLALAYFDGAAWPDGWITVGKAFGAGPVAGPIGGQSAVSGWQGAGFASSFHGGDGAIGTLRSPTFVTDRRYLHLQVAGGNHPGETCVNLLDGGKVVATATGRNSEAFSWTTWDLAERAGHTLQVEIIDASAGGWGHVMVDSILLSNDAEPSLAGLDGRFAARDARALRWGDWTLTMRQAQDADHRIDTTLGRGMPYTWLEFTGVQPRLALPEGSRLFRLGAAAGEALPLTGEAIGVEVQGRGFGVYAPAGTRFTAGKDSGKGQGGTVDVAFAGAGEGADAPRWLVIAALPTPDAAGLAALRDGAGALPRGSRMDWTYDAAQAEVRTRWTLDLAQLRPGETAAPLQGWLPHHYRGTTHSLALDGPRYRTPRGELRTAAATPGAAFEIAYPFAGVLPEFPAPRPSGGEHDYDAARMQGFLAAYAAKDGYGGDTYWGGKDLVRLARYFNYADELGDPSAAALHAKLAAALGDWLSYTPGEREHYFARYPNWRALVGFNESYGSAQFSDNHFHYGYFTLAAGLLGLRDPAFLADYGDMARLVARQYANWDRANTDFPFMRTFDIWEGHSWAGGFSSPGGNNQESSSEAMQAWAGLFTLGAALDDPGMLAAGAMGYAMEQRAIMEYWFDVHGDVFDAAYAPSITGILQASGQAYATYFSGDPAWIHGIQWLPVSPALDYLARDPAWAAMELDRMLAEQRAKQPDTAVAVDIPAMGSGLGNVVLGFAMWSRPDWVAERLDAYHAAALPIVTDAYTGGIVYYDTHSLRALGQRDWGWHTDLPMSAVYRNAATGVRTVVCYNHQAAPRFATVYDGPTPVGRVFAPGRRMVARTELLPNAAAGADAAAASAPIQALALLPGDDGAPVPRFQDRLWLAFSQPVAAASLAGIALDGPAAPTLTVATPTPASTPASASASGPALASADAPASPAGPGPAQVHELRLSGLLQPGATYTLRLPAMLHAATASATAAPLRIRVEAAPALTLLESNPAADAARVPLGPLHIHLRFNAPMTGADLSAATLRGPGITGTGLAAPAIDGPEIRFTATGTLQPDSDYQLTLPAGLRGISAEPLAAPLDLAFRTAPPPCPPTLYRDAYSGGHIVPGGTAKVDLRCTDGPAEGRFEIKITGGERGGDVAFYAGTAANGDGRAPIDLSGYQALAMQIRSDGPSAWLKIGHPVFDKAFHQTHHEDLLEIYQPLRLPIPQPATGLNTLLVISVAPGQTLYLDDLHYLPRD